MWAVWGCICSESCLQSRAGKAKERGSGGSCTRGVNTTPSRFWGEINRGSVIMEHNLAYMQNEGYKIIFSLFCMIWEPLESHSKKASMSVSLLSEYDVIVLMEYKLDGLHLTSPVSQKNTGRKNVNIGSMILEVNLRFVVWSSPAV